MSRSFEFLAFFDFFVVNFGGLPNVGIFFFMHYKFSFQIDVDGAYQILNSIKSAQNSPKKDHNLASEASFGLTFLSASSSCSRFYIVYGKCGSAVPIAVPAVLQ